jgi:electron transfer flavoprotein beta subunit
MLAERLAWPQMTYANKVDVDPAAGTLTIHRLTDDGFDTVESSLPAVVSVVEKINEPRYPSFKGIMAAKKKPVETLALSDLGLEAATVGLAGAWTAVNDAQVSPPRQAGTVITDEGDAGTKVAEFLTTAKFI